VIVTDMDHALRQFRTGAYDVILLSFVLSSMQSLPDFTELARVLAPGGTLLVTDIKPGYTHAKPLYRVRVEEDEVALRTVPVDPFEIVHRATACGLQKGEQQTFGDGPTYYSFMIGFTKSPVTDGGPAAGGELLRAVR
jgi:SAM-dependent methyltransferase